MDGIVSLPGRKCLSVTTELAVGSGQSKRVLVRFFSDSLDFGKCGFDLQQKLCVLGRVLPKLLAKSRDHVVGLCCKCVCPATFSGQ